MSYEYERVAASGDALRLHLNENTAGCSPKVIAALQRLTRHDIATYPDYDAAVDACAARLGVDPGRLLLTNGLDDGILAAAVSALQHSPVDGAVRGDRRRARVRHVRRLRRRRRRARRRGAARTRVRVSGRRGARGDHAAHARRLPDQPEQPDRRERSRATSILAIAARRRRRSLFVDEAYADFSGETLIGDAAFAALAERGRRAHVRQGLRAGRAPRRRAGRHHPRRWRRCAGRFRRTRSTSAATVALPAAFDDVELLRLVPGAGARVADAALPDARAARASSTGRAPRTSCSRGSATISARVIAGLAARQVTIRDRSRDPGCAGCARITTGVVEHTRALRRQRSRRSCAARRSQPGHDGDVDRAAARARRPRPLRGQHRHPVLRSHAGAGHAPRRVRPDARR